MLEAAARILQVLQMLPQINLNAPVKGDYGTIFDPKILAHKLIQLIGCKYTLLCHGIDCLSTNLLLLRSSAFLLQLFVLFGKLLLQFRDGTLRFFPQRFVLACFGKTLLLCLGLLVLQTRKLFLQFFELFAVFAPFANEFGVLCFDQFKLCGNVWFSHWLLSFSHRHLLVCFSHTRDR